VNFTKNIFSTKEFEIVSNEPPIKHIMKNNILNLLSPIYPNDHHISYSVGICDVMIFLDGSGLK